MARKSHFTLLALCYSIKKRTNGHNNFGKDVGLRFWGQGMKHLRALPVWEGRTDIGAAVSPAENNHLDDLSRKVFGVLGLPLDVLGLEDLLQRIDDVVDARSPFLLSTPNVNFLMLSRSDSEFHESLLMSDLCPVDGMPLVWIARLLGIPIRERLSGSDIFEALKSRNVARKLSVFFFGGSDDVGLALSKKLNQEASGLTCAGVLNPGFGTVADMSSDLVVDSINASNADLLTVFLSAKKGQGWLLRNHDRLRVPFRAQFGATINLQAGRVKRAPLFMRKLECEWLWRIKEEPYLWRRYWTDGFRLLSLVLTCVLPLAVRNLLRRPSSDAGFTISRHKDLQAVLVKPSGSAIARHIDAAISCFHMALDARKSIVIDLSNVSAIDARFFGLLLMLRKRAFRQASDLKFVNATPQIRRTFRLNGFEFLLRA
jgi:N-acetylglucosaminyldiphosphoundecaprenol N-acetyl-beta-D-mannosaminyltransferase